MVKKSLEQEAADLQVQIKALEAEIERKEKIKRQQDEVKRLRRKLRDLRYRKARKLASALGRTGKKILKSAHKYAKERQKRIDKAERAAKRKK